MNESYEDQVLREFEATQEKEEPKVVTDLGNINDGKKDIEYVLVNPKIVAESAQKCYLSSGEGCLSVPGEHKGLVPRSMRIKVRAYDLITDQEIEFTAEDYLAVVLQHEIDHFSGRLFYDRINKTNPWQQDDDLELI